MDEAIGQRIETKIPSETWLVKERLQIEFDRRIYELRAYISDLEGVLGVSLNEWFIVPPVLNRTDFGYSNDIDFVVLLPFEAQKDYEQIVALTQRYVEGRDLFFTPYFITEEELEEIKTKAPEMHSWYQKKFSETKPKGERLEDTGFFDQSKELEDKLRRLLSPREKESLRQEYLKIAEEFIEEARKRVGIKAWTITGSTIETQEKFGLYSDLDLEILTNPKDKEQEEFEWNYLHQYLIWKYAEERGVKIDCFEWSEGDLRHPLFRKALSSRLIKR